MVEFIGFLIVFLILAALIGTLATGVVRLIAFGILAALAIMLSGPILPELSSLNPFSNSSGPSSPTTAPYDTTTVTPGSGSSSGMGTSSTSGTTTSTTGGYGVGGTSTPTTRPSYSGQGIPARW